MDNKKGQAAEQFPVSSERHFVHCLANFCGSSRSSSQFRNAKPKTENQHMKGQAAVEYLATYGWALLILAIVIAAILAMGVFNPNYFVIEECYLGPSFNCHAQLVGEAAQTRLLLNISQALGYPVKVKNMSFYSENLGSASTGLDAFMNSSDSKVLETVFSKSSFKGTVKKITMNLTYYICAEEINPSCDSDSAFLRTISGRVVMQTQ